jgi:hypothetical protein
VLANAALPALVQLRHEFVVPQLGGRVVAAVTVAAAGALVVGNLVDLVLPAPRFDRHVPRGLLAVVAGTGFGATIGYLMLQSNTYTQFADGRGTFIAAAVGALVGLLAVGVAYVEVGVAVPERRLARALRATLGVTVPLGVVAPVAFLLCLAIRA